MSHVSAWNQLYFFLQLSCPAILQVKKVDIVSAPQMNTDSQAAPRMLKIGLTDGKTTCYGIEFEHIPRLRLVQS